MGTFVIKNKTNEFYTTEARAHFNQLADYYFYQFNYVKETGRYPARYRCIEDALKDLQYLTERCKIIAFEMNDEAAVNW